MSSNSIRVAINDPALMIFYINYEEAKRTHNSDIAKIARQIFDSMNDESKSVIPKDIVDTISVQTNKN